MKEGGFEILKKLSFIITIRYEITTFSSVEIFFEEGKGVEKILKILFSVSQPNFGIMSVILFCSYILERRPQLTFSAFRALSAIRIPPAGS